MKRVYCLLDPWQYWRQYRPKEWLFEGQKEGTHICISSIRQIFLEAKERAGITKPASPHTEKREIHILDLGCGDGVLTQELLGKNETIIATLVDGSLTMLQKARERLTAYSGIHFIHARFQELLTGKIFLGHFDLCVSSFAIHHLEMKEKNNLFRYIYEHLNTEGYFVNIDVVLSPSQGFEEWYFSIWREWMQHMQNRLNLKDELPENIIRRYKDPSSMNKPDTLEAQLNALREIGFRDVDCYYKNGIFVVFGGER